VSRLAKLASLSERAKGARGDSPRVAARSRLVPPRVGKDYTARPTDGPTTAAVCAILRSRSRATLASSDDANSTNTNSSLGSSAAEDPVPLG